MLHFCSTLSSFVKLEIMLDQNFVGNCRFCPDLRILCHRSVFCASEFFVYWWRFVSRWVSQIFFLDQNWVRPDQAFCCLNDKLHASSRSEFDGTWSGFPSKSFGLSIIWWDTLHVCSSQCAFQLTHKCEDWLKWGTQLQLAELWLVFETLNLTVWGYTQFLVYQFLFLLFLAKDGSDWLVQ